MVTYNSKLVTVLSGYNVIEFTNAAEFDEFRKVLAGIGCDIRKENFEELVKDAQYDAARHNRPYGFGEHLVAGWSNKYGFQYGWRDMHRCIMQFDEGPFTWKEIKEELV